MSTHEALADLLTELGTQLLEHGSSTHRLEACLVASAEAYGCRAEVFAVPTGLWMSITPEGARPIVRLARIHARTVDLSGLARLDEIFNEVADRRLSVEAAMEALVELRRREGLPLWLVDLSGALASGSAAFFFGGGLLEGLFGLLLGGLIMVLTRWIGRSTRTRLLLDFCVGMAAGLAGWLLTLLDPELCRRAVMLAGIIVIVPGLSITSGLGELAQKNLVSGTARLMEAAMVLLSLIFGGAAISTLEAKLGALAPGGPGVSHPFWLMGLVAAVAAGSFVVLFAVPRRDAPWAALAGLISWLIPALLALALGPLSPPGATFAGALAVGLFANLMARLKDRPTQTYLVPGVILLVPGVFGFVSLEKILVGDVMGGMAGAFATLMTAGALIIALLLAHALLPPRKIL